MQPLQPEIANRILSLRQARQIMDFVDNRSIEKFCLQNAVDIFYMANSNRRYVWEVDFYKARDNNLKNKDGINLLQYLQASNNETSEEIKNVYPIEPGFDSEGQQSYSMHPVIDDPTKIKYFKIPGYYIRCNMCDTWVRESCKKINKSIGLCPHKEDLRLLSVIGNKDGRETLVLPTKNVFMGAQMHLKRLEAKKLGAIIPKTFDETDNAKEAKSSKSLSELMQLYCDVISGKGVSKAKMKIKSVKHQDEVKRVFSNYKSCLEKNNVSPDISAENLTETHIDFYHDELESRSLSGRSYNKYLGILHGLYRFLIKKGYVTQNPFDGITWKSENTKREDTITQEKFNALLEAFKSRKLGKQVFNNSRRTVHREYLGDIATYGIFSGRRLTELCFSKWSDVKSIDGSPAYIEFIDRKATSRKNSPDAKPKIITVPLIPQLKDFLINAGMESKIGKDEFIIAPNEINRKGMTGIVSAAFSHYYKQIDNEKHLTFHCLRRTYLTQLTKVAGPELSRLYGGHQQFSTMQNHYLNPKELLPKVNDLKIFNEENENKRQRELSDLKKPEQKISLSR